MQLARQYSGVHAMNGRFHSSVRTWDRDISLGFFDTALEAAVAHDQGMRMFYGPSEEVPLNFKDGKKSAVERRVAALIAENKHGGAVAPLKKGNEKVNNQEGAARAVRQIMDIPGDTAVTMIGASMDAANGVVLVALRTQTRLGAAGITFALIMGDS